MIKITRNYDEGNSIEFSSYYYSIISDFIDYPRPVDF